MNDQALVKTCNKCGEAKPLSGFNKNHKNRDGRSYTCTVCQRVRNLAYYQANRERLIADLAVKRAADRDGYNAYMRTYNKTWVPSDETQTKLRLRQESYRKRNLEKFAIKEQRRRSWKRANGGTFIPKDWRRALHRYRGLCAYCQARPADSIDHVLSIRRGGSGFIGNLLPCCKTCNSRKRELLLSEFRYVKGIA